MFSCFKVGEVRRKCIDAGELSLVFLLPELLKRSRVSKFIQFNKNA